MSGEAAGLAVRLRQDFPTARIDVAFEAPAAGVTVLFGPSGSGKSTVIAAVAGLLRPSLCRVAIGPALLADTASGLFLPPERRRLGMVFQDSRLFPHMSVATNLRFGLRRAGRVRIGFDEVVALLDIAPLLRRRPATLSGGERQRVAIGRALLAQPHLLLMDEPLASLDAARKAEILPYLARLKRELRLPILYVTHSLDELMALADWVVLLDRGAVLAGGTVGELSTRLDLPLSRREDAGAVLGCVVAEHDPARRLSRLDWGAVPIWVAQVERPVGAPIRVRLPAREVILGDEAIAGSGHLLSLHNIVPGVVQRIGGEAPAGTALVQLRTEAGFLLARVTPDAVERLGLRPEGRLSALFKSVSLEVVG